MPAVSFKSKKISGERKKEIKEFKDEISIGYEFDILNVVEKDYGGEKNLDIDFEFRVKYDPDVGNLSLQGTLTYKPENENDYRKNEKNNVILSPKTYEKISNILMKMSIIELFGLARSLYLPVPINLPTVRLVEPKANANLTKSEDTGKAA